MSTKIEEKAELTKTMISDDQLDSLHSTSHIKEFKDSEYLDDFEYNTPL